MFLFLVSLAVTVEDLARVLVGHDVGELTVDGACRYASLFRVLVRVTFVGWGVRDVFGAVFVRRAEVVRSRTKVRCD